MFLFWHTPSAYNYPSNTSLALFMLIYISSSLASILGIYLADRTTLYRGRLSLGMVIICMYVATYGLGLLLWRLNPDSLYGYGTISTIGSLNRLMYIFCVGISGISAGYLAVSQLLKLNKVYTGSSSSLYFLAEQHKRHLSWVGSLLLIISTLSIVVMLSLGVFSRIPEVQSKLVESSVLAKLLVGSGVLSRLAPISFVLLPLYFRQSKPNVKIVILSLLVIWIAAAFFSQSRSLLISLPLYYLIGLVLWKKISKRHLLIVILISIILALPAFEFIRIHREGDASNSELQKTFQTFQIGKQLMGTSHEFYLMLNPKDCRKDLQDQLLSDPLAAKIYSNGASSYPPNSYERWHIVGRYASCAENSYTIRGLSDLKKIPLGLFPSSIVRSSPSLFDGQQLSQKISSYLDLKPGEISYSTLSLFADSWWRLRESGVLISSLILGCVLAIFQRLSISLLESNPILGIFAQLLMLTLIGSWINNTVLTMSWHLFWELPRTLLEILLLITVIKRLSRKTFFSKPS